MINLEQMDKSYKAQLNPVTMTLWRDTVVVVVVLVVLAEKH